MLTFRAYRWDFPFRLLTADLVFAMLPVLDWNMHLEPVIHYQCCRIARATKLWEHLRLAFETLAFKKSKATSVFSASSAAARPTIWRIFSV